MKPLSCLRHGVLSLTLLLSINAHAQIGEPLESLLIDLEPYDLSEADLGYTTSTDFAFDTELRSEAVHRVFGAGVLNEENIDFASVLVGVASGYGADLATPVAEFFSTRIGELSGAGPTELALEQYTLIVDVTGEQTPYNIRLEVALREIAEDLFPTTQRALGPEDARYVIREFSDFQCPFCAQFALGPLEVIKNELLARGDVRLEFHHLPLVSIHANAFTAAEASECVAAENDNEGFWIYHDALFQRQAAWQGLEDPSDYFVQLALENELNIDQMARCLSERDSAIAIDDAYKVAGETLGISGTPSVFVNGYRVANFGELESYQNIIALIDAFTGE